MTAEEIRTAKNFADTYGFWLREIAAQLAELNASFRELTRNDFAASHDYRPAGYQGDANDE